MYELYSFYEVEIFYCKLDLIIVLWTNIYVKFIGCKMRKGKRQVGDNSQPVREMLRWTDEMDNRVLNAMVEEARAGNRIDGSWTPQAYTKIVQTLRDSGLTDVTKNHVKNRQKTMKDRWREIHDLFNGLSGFAWSPVTKRFEAEDEVWDELIKVNVVKHFL